MNELQQTLSGIEEAGWSSNPVTNALLMDYTQYHTIATIASSIVLLLFAGLCLFFLIRFWKTPPTSKWRFDKKTCFAFTLLSACLVPIMIWVISVNAPKALDPSQGFSSFIAAEINEAHKLIEVEPTQGQIAVMEDSAAALNQWILSEDASVPPAFDVKINSKDYLTETLKSSFWLLFFIASALFFWLALIKGARLSRLKWTFKELAFFFCGLASLPLILLLIAKVTVNFQGFCAPLTPLVSSLL